MDRATDDIFPPQKRPRTGGLQGDAARTGPFPQSSSFYSGTGDQFNTPDGTQNISKGNGPQFPGAKFEGPVYFGTQEPVHPLQDCLKSLAFLEMVSRFHDIDIAAQGTCQWLLQHQMYTGWASCDRGLLWIKGKPGSGKSTLLSHVLRNIVAAESDLILSFFFHGRGAGLQRTPLGLFQALLHQLLNEIPDTLQDLVATFQERCKTIGKPGVNWQWHPHELQRFFESSIPKVLMTRTVWLFVDALDECGGENAVNLVEEFKSLLQRLPPSGLKQFHICFTCRHYPILDLDGVFEICIENENRKDISTFVQDKLSSFRVRTSSTIPDLMTKRADGVFLWARLMVKQVLDLEREGIGLKQIEAKIRSVPQKLNDLYCELIRNMDPNSLKLIEWICFAMRPLSLDELRWAMAVESDCRHQSLRECESVGKFPPDYGGMKRRVQTLSCGLAEVIDLDTSSASIGHLIREARLPSHAQVVQFIHQSVKDFFIEKGLSALNGSPITAKPDFVVGMVHYRLSRICIRYLAMEEIGLLASRDSYWWSSRFPFLQYAMTSWVAHTKQSDARSVPQDDLLEYFTWPSNIFVERWVRIYGILEKYSKDCPLEGTSLVHIMSSYGVVGALGTILERTDQIGINIDSKDSYGRTPLIWAAKGGHEAVVRLLLDRGADIEAADEDEGQTPLLWAAEEGYEAVVRLLLDRGADIEAAAEGEGQTPLLWAAEEGHEAVMQLLLDRDADIEAADKRGRTPLIWAAKGGHEAVVRLLLDRGADIEAADKMGRTPLLWATANGREAVMRLLLDRGADIEAADERGRTPLSWTAKGGHEAVVRLLLDRDADIEAADERGWTPLSSAAVEGDDAIIRLLESNGAQPLSTASTQPWRPDGEAN
ncbi:hypothetical protein BKA56DRAFT_549653 [Ilyonectria sp. MPI-CAGE-AT-0026]|nr:hypothetical protein BKA56DRAFT_549653 [Ilyonectria sp. MPI-CAGE-AT-0026]